MTDNAHETGSAHHDANSTTSDGVLISDIIARVKRGATKTISLGILGTALGCVAGVLVLVLVPRQSECRVSFAFPGFERGRYPDGTTFVADDLRAPDVVAAAYQNHKDAFKGIPQSDIRSAIAVVGLVSPSIVKERDRLRASGQTPPPFYPDEYQVTLALSRGNGIDSRDQEGFLNDLTAAYQERFRRTYMAMPPQYGKAFDSLSKADYFEYELVLNEDLQMLDNYLKELVSGSGDEREKPVRTAASTFRSPTTGYSFNELLSQTRNFEHLKLTEVMGLIQSTGLAKNRETALIKMDYRIRILGEEEKRLSEEESMIRDLMAKADARGQSYVLGIKSQSAVGKNDSLIDQGLLDTLVQNDSFNYLVHRAIDAGIRVREVAAQKNELIERSERMKKFLEKADVVKAGTQQSVDGALASLEKDYRALLNAVRQTYEDFTRQELGTAVRITVSPHTPSAAKQIALVGVGGAFIGLLLGVGLSLLKESAGGQEV